MKIRLLALLAALALALAGCGGEEIDAEKLVQESADAFDQAETFHFLLAVSEGQPGAIQTPLGGLLLRSAEGDFRRPEALSASLKAQLSDVPLPINLQVVLLDSEAYISNPLDPSRWEQLQDTTSLAGLSPATAIASVLRGMQDIQVQGRETIGGDETIHLTGAADAALLGPLVGGTAQAGTLQIDTWIDPLDKLPRRIIATGPIVPNEPQAIKRTLDLSAYGESVTIEKPQ